MTKRKKLVKKAFDNPELFTEADLSYMALWAREHKNRKNRLSGVYPDPETTKLNHNNDCCN